AATRSLMPRLVTELGRTAISAFPDRSRNRPLTVMFPCRRPHQIRLPGSPTAPIEAALMTSTAPIAEATSFPHRHLLTCETLTAAEITALLDLADKAAEINRQVNKKRDVLRGRTLINLFFEASTRTQS